MVVLRSVRAGAPQSAGQRAAALQARRVMLPCGAPRVTSQLVRADRIRTNVYRGTNVYGGAYPYYGWGAVAAGVATGATLGAAAATPYYYPYYPQPIIHLTAGHLTRRPTPRTVRIPIRTAAMCKARQAVALTAALAAATFNAKGAGSRHRGWSCFC